MHRKTASTTLLLTAAVIAVGNAQAADEKKSGIIPKVDKPIPDTYEPLDGADWNHRMSDELKTLREYQKQNQEKAEAERQLKLRQELESKIQAPDPGAANPAAPPEVIESDNKLQISDPE